MRAEKGRGADPLELLLCPQTQIPLRFLQILVSPKIVSFLFLAKGGGGGVIDVKNNGMVFFPESSSLGKKGKLKTL